MAFLFDKALDAALDVVADDGDRVLLCSSEPATYGAAVAAALAQRDVTPGDGNGDYDIDDNDGDGGGRMLSLAEQADVPCTGDGTATHLVIVDTAGAGAVCFSMALSVAVVTVTDQLVTIPAQVLLRLPDAVAAS